MQKLSDAHYNSVAEFMDSVTADLVSEKNRAGRDAYFAEKAPGGGAGWFGANCNNAKDVQRLISKGWPEGLAKLTKFMGKLGTIDLLPRDRRRRILRTDMGDHLDIAAVYAGRHQSAWTRAWRQPGVGPQRVDIFANMICSGGDDADVLFWRGVAAIALCDKLEAAGYMVRLVVGFGGTLWGASETISCRITVKNYDMPLDMATTSAVTLPGFFRALGHAWTCAHAKAQTGDGCMTVGNGKTEDGELILSHDVKNESQARAWVQKQITELEAPKEEAA